MTNLAYQRAFEEVVRKPPASEGQYNLLTGGIDIVPEQMELPLPPVDDVVLPDDGSVVLLSTENGSQLFVSGFGLFIGKKSERVVVRQGKSVCAQVPLMRLQEIIVASRGISFSSDLIEEMCERGIRIACLTSSGKPFALLTSPMLTATVETRRAQFAAYQNERGAELCRWIVAGKLHNQEKLLRYFAKNREGERASALEKCAATLRRLRRSSLAAEGKTPDDVRGELMGLEGTGGRLYWQQIGNMLPDGLGFQGRSHQGATDGVNAALNYGYGILTAHVWGAVMNAGLEPFAGFLHARRPERQTVPGAGPDGGIPPADRRSGDFLLAEQRRATDTGEGNARRPLKGKRSVPRAPAPGRDGTAPWKAAPGAVHRPNAGPTGGERGARLAPIPLILVQVVSHGAEEQIHRRVEAVAPR